MPDFALFFPFFIMCIQYVSRHTGDLLKTEVKFLNRADSVRLIMILFVVLRCFIVRVTNKAFINQIRPSFIFTSPVNSSDPRSVHSIKVQFVRQAYRAIKVQIFAGIK